jgi:putative acetyltransferase
MASIQIRQIAATDNAAIAAVIRQALRDFGADRPGTVFTDPTTDHLFELFNQPGSIYFVATIDEELVGGCGIYPTEGLPAGCAELVKLYVAASARGKGIGKLLMEKSMEAAKALGYKQLYLESLPELNKAVHLYEKTGFKHLCEPMGDSGHFACNLWMLKDL